MFGCWVCGESARLLGVHEPVLGEFTAVVRDETGWHYASKIVVLDSRRIDTLLAIPL